MDDRMEKITSVNEFGARANKAGVPKHLLDAFNKATQDLANALAQAEQTPTLHQAIDRLAEIESIVDPFEDEKKNLRNLCKAQTVPAKKGDQVRHTTDKGNVGLSYLVDQRNFDYKELGQMIDEATERKDTRTLGTIRRVLARCVRVTQSHAFKVNP